jgi:hypothetical protein
MVRVGTHFGDTALHDQKIGVIDVELHTLKYGLDDVLLSLVAIQEVFRDIWESNLARRWYL